MAMAFPLLSFEEAVASCRELFKVNIGEEELRRPTSQFVKKLYLDIITATMHMSPEQMLQPHFKFLSTFQYPDIAEEGASFLYFTILLQRYMHACMVRDFSKNDLSNPKPKRTLSCISALVNFEKFKVSQSEHFDTALQEREALYEQKNQLLLRNQELRKKITQIKAVRSEEEEKVQQILPVVDDLDRAVAELNRQQNIDFKEGQQLKTKVAEQISREAEMKVLIAQTKEECEKLKGQIVTSPEKFRGELNRMTDAIDTCKLSISEKNEKLLEKKNQEESINLLEENCEIAVKCISSIEEEAERLRDLQHKCQDMHDLVTADDETLGKCNLKCENLKRILTSQDEKLNRLKRTNEKTSLAKNDEFEHRKRNVEMLEGKRKQCEAEISQINAEFQDVVKTMNELEGDHAKKMDAMENGYQQMITSINNYHSMLEDGSKRLLTTLSEDK